MVKCKGSCHGSQQNENSQIALIEVDTIATVNQEAMKRILPHFDRRTEEKGHGLEHSD
jgi:hypothetical protein